MIPHAKVVGLTATPFRSDNKALEGDIADVKCLVVRRTGDDVEMRDGLDVWLHDALEDVSDDCPPICSIGVSARKAHATPVMALVQPGPAVVTTQPNFPVCRA